MRVIRLFALALVVMCLALPSLGQQGNCVPNGISQQARHGHYAVSTTGLTWALLPLNSTGASFNRNVAVGMVLALEERTPSGQTVRTAAMNTMTCSANVIKSNIPIAPGSTKTVSMESIVLVGAVMESPQTLVTIAVQTFGGNGVLASNGQNINVDSRTARMALAVSGWQFEDSSNNLRISVSSEYVIHELVDYEITRSHGHPARVKIQSDVGEAIVTFDEQVFVDGIARPFTSNFEDIEREKSIVMQFPMVVPSGSLIEWAYTSRFQISNDVEPIDAPESDNAPSDANTSYEQTAKVVALVLLAVFLVICAAGAVFVLRRFYWAKSEEEGRPLREYSSSNEEVELV